MSRTALVSVGGGLLLIVVLALIGFYPMAPHLFGLDSKQPNVPVNQTPIDAATLSSHPGLYYLDAGNLTGTLSTDRFSAYQDLQDEKKIGQGSTLLTDQNVADKAVTGIAAGLGLSSATVNGTVTVSLVPGTGLVMSNGRLTTTLGNAVDLNSSETVSVLPVAKGGTGLSSPPLAGEVLVGTGTGYTYGLLSDGDGTKLINASGQLSYNVDATVCRTSGNCAGAGGGITGSGTPNHLARFSSAGTLTDSTLYDTGSAIGIGTTSPQAVLDIHAPDSALGPELVTNGSFNGSANGWNLYDCGSYANGQVTVNYTSTCAWDDVSTTIATKVGEHYQVSFDVIAENGDQAYFYTNQISGYNGPYGVGHYTVNITGGTTGTDTIYFEGWNWNDGSSWTIDNVSIRQVGTLLSVDGDVSVTGVLNVASIIGANNGVVTVNSGLGVNDLVSPGASTGQNIGISASMTINPTASGSSTNEGLNVSAMVPATNAFALSAVHGLVGTAFNFGTGSLSALDGIRATSINSGNAALTYIRGLYVNTQSSAGTVTNVRGIDLAAQVSGGAVTTQYGIQLNAVTISGGAAVANRYGLYIGSMTGSTTSTNDFALYSLPTQKSYMAGSLGLGTSSPQNKLDINGGLAVGAYAGASAAPSNGLIVSGNVGLGVTTGINSRLTFAADTTAAGGILFGTDTNLYRSAANTLMTDGLFNAKTGLIIGSGGTQIKKFLSATATWDPASVATGAMTSTTITVTGAALGDTAVVSFTNAVPAGMVLSGQVTAANTVTVTLLNMSGSTQDLASGTLRADIWQH